jgi:hypothetical protein
MIVACFDCGSGNPVTATYESPTKYNHKRRNNVSEGKQQTRRSGEIRALVPHTDCFHLENFMPLGNQIEILIQSLKQREDLGWLSRRTPGCKARNIGKEDGAVWEKVSDRLLIVLRGKFVAIQKRLELVSSGDQSFSLALFILL